MLCSFFSSHLIYCCCFCGTGCFEVGRVATNLCTRIAFCQLLSVIGVLGIKHRTNRRMAVRFEALKFWFFGVCSLGQTFMSRQARSLFLPIHTTHNTTVWIGLQTAGHRVLRCSFRQRENNRSKQAGRQHFSVIHILIYTTYDLPLLLQLPHARASHTTHTNRTAGHIFVFWYFVACCSLFQSQLGRCRMRTH